MTPSAYDKFLGKSARQMVEIKPVFQKFWFFKFDRNPTPRELYRYLKQQYYFL